MKRTILLVGAGLLLAGCQGTKPEQTPPAVIESITPQPQTITVVINDGANVATFSSVANNEATALNVLTKAAEAEGVKVGVQTYDFGSLVTAIGDKQNSTERAWIYFVNGQAGDVGADQRKVQAGEVVEWKYIQPIY